MPAFRSTIRAALALSTFVLASWAQDSQTSGTFRLSPGTSFTADARPAEPNTKLPPALKLISDDFGEAIELIGSHHASARRDDKADRLSFAINGMLKELDPHSKYYTPKEFKALNDDHRGLYFGIGTTLSGFTRNGETGVYILAVKRNSPAERAGLKFGDRVLRVDGKDVTELDTTAVRDMVRGVDGTYVSLTVDRWGTKDPMVFKARRALVPEPSIPASFILSDGVGYIALTEGFGYSTAAEFDDALRKLHAQGMTSLIVDLRGNGGGLMDQAIRIAEKFLPAGRVIVSQHSRRPADEQSWVSANKLPDTRPLVLLVDENTASASEIFAAAMQDNDRATIVGTRTFGKGLVQDVIPFDDGSGLVLTSERYYTPSGRSIQRDYSDSGLYDYFRHISKGTLVDKPTFAARTLKGRVVYGGDGIAPDISVPSKQWSPQELADYDEAFFSVVENLTTTAAVSSSHVRWFRATRDHNKELANRIAQEADLQLRAALAVITKAK